jgi:branched-chain amino acid transport system permease protein
MDYFLEQAVNGLSLGCMYAFIALGYTMVYGIIKLINFAHGEFFMTGAVLGYISLHTVPVETLPLPEGLAPAAGLLVAILVAAFGTAAFAVLCEKLLYKPLRGEGRIAAVAAALYGLLFVLLLWKPVSGVSVLLATALLFGGVWALLAVLPRHTDHWSRSRMPGGRIAALLTALGLSLALQNGGVWLFSATPRAWPESKAFLTWDQIRERYAPARTAEAEPGEAKAKLDANLFRIEGLDSKVVFYRGQTLGAAQMAKLAELEKTERGLFIGHPFSTNVKKVMVFVALVVSGALLWVLVIHTNLGKAMRAVSYNADAARLMGINANQVIAFTFFIGAFIAGVGAVLWGVRYGKVEPYMGFLPGLKAFVAAVLGGIGSIPGAILGGVLLGLVETLVAAYGFSAFRDAVAFVILIVILLVKPSGLLGGFEGEKV